MLEWRKKECLNTGRQIEGIRKEIITIQEQGGQRDWESWSILKSQVDKAYKTKYEYWARQSRIEWLKAGNKNKKYFHAVTGQRMGRNKIERLENQEGDVCEGGQEIG